MISIDPEGTSFKWFVEGVRLRLSIPPLGFWRRQPVSSIPAT